MHLVTPRVRAESEAGWHALSEGRWRDARSSFERSLALTDTPESREGLSWAAWWLDDAQVVFEARERAYRLYRERGDSSSAGRMAIWMAIDHLDFHGAAAVAQGWLQRARRHLGPIAPGPDHGWLAFLEGYLAHGAGDTVQARERGLSAAELGRRFEVPDLEMLGLALEGAALVASGDVEPGMRCLDEATTIALAGEATVPISGAWACCFLVSACTSSWDMERAAEWCARIAEFAARYGSRYMLAFCRSEYGTVFVWQGRWDEAEAMLVAASEDYAESRPAWQSGPLVELAELRRRQGRYEETIELLERAGSSRAALECRAATELDRGDAARAANLLERLLRELPPDRVLQRASAVGLLARAYVESERLDEAAAMAAELEDMARRVATPPLRASACFASGLVETARNRHEPARRLFEDAVDGFVRSGAPYETALARIALSGTLSVLGRKQAAAEELDRANAALTALGVARAGARPAAPGGTEESGRLGHLTKRERDVVDLLAEGLTNRQIANRLVLSEHTVHRHVTNILRKLDVPTRTAAATLAVRGRRALDVE